MTFDELARSASLEAIRSGRCDDAIRSGDFAPCLTDAEIAHAIFDRWELIKDRPLGGPLS